jgi:cytosol alanyl aminopeptidase
LGYYRVNYGGNLVASLTDGDIQKRLGAAERVDLLGNAQALASTGKLSDGAMLSLLPKFGNDPSRYVVERAIAMARTPETHLVPDSLRANYQRFIRKTFQERARELGWSPKPGEDDDARLLRPTLLHFVATSGADEQLAKEARELTEKWFTDHNSIPADEVREVLETAAFYGDRALFERFLTQFRSVNDRQERRQVLSALTSFRNPDAIKAGMAAVLNGDVSFIDAQPLLYAGQHDEETRMLAFDFMKQNIDALAAKRATGGGSDSGARFASVGASFCDAQSERELKQFFEPKVKQFVGAPRMLAQTLESIQSCIANKAAQQPSVESFLKGY